MQALTIAIRQAVDEDGFFYDIYACSPDEIDEEDSLDGGLCTTSMENTLEMAYEGARALLSGSSGK